MNADFTHLHVHTQFSLLDSALRLKSLFQKAADDKMEAVAMTDHGNMFGAIEFYLTAKKFGIKPILGCEMYLVQGSRLQKGNHENPDKDDENPIRFDDIQKNRTNLCLEYLVTADSGPLRFGRTGKYGPLRL